MGNLAVVKIQVVGRRIVGLKHCEVFGAEMVVALLALQHREKGRQIGIVAE